MMKTEPLPSYTFREQLRQGTKHGSEQLKDTTDPPSRTRQYQRSNRAARPLEMTTMMMWNSLLLLGRADSVHRSSKRSFHGCLTGLRRLKNILDSKGAWQHVTRIENLLSHACLPQVALPLGRVCGKCLDGTRSHHQRAEKTWQQNVDWLWPVSVVWILLGPSYSNTEDLQHRRSYAGTPRVRPRRPRRTETYGPGHHHGTQRTHRIAIQAG